MENLPQITFQPARHEAGMGYTRRFKIGEQAGAIVFMFEGEREDREFYLSFMWDASRTGTEQLVEVNRVLGDDVEGLVTGVMQDDHTAVSIIHWLPSVHEILEPAFL